MEPYDRAQNEAALEAARRVAFREETGIFLVLRKKQGRDYEVTVLGQVNAEEIRDAMLGAVMALGKIAEKGSAVGLVLDTAV